MAAEAIFIGYRRDDTADVAGRIYDAIARRFGKGRIFKDVDNIGPGVDFGDYIKSVLPRCSVALILIGPHWTESRDSDGARRLDGEHDWVRVEIETALATPGLLVVPVLVNGARMPRNEDVPDAIRPLLRRNAAIVRRDPDFHDDVERLASALRTSVRTGILDLSKIGGETSRKGASANASWTRLALLGGVVVATALLGVLAYNWLNSQPSNVAQPAQIFRDCPECPEMVRVPAGEFVKGNGPNSRSVHVDAFAVGRYEVTVGQWRACVAVGACESREAWEQNRTNDWPISVVTWHHAKAYVDWLTQRTGQQYRLLTGDEWEYAARAGTTTRFSWGNQNPSCDPNAADGANFSVSCDRFRAMPVGSFQPNAFGLYDMHGNVWEWVEDCGGANCASRGIRGGGWYNVLVGSADRYVHDPGQEYYGYGGFRVARVL